MHIYIYLCMYIYIYLPIFIFIQEGDAHDDHGQAAPALTVRTTNGFARSMWGLVGTARLRPRWPAGTSWDECHLVI